MQPLKHPTAVFNDGCSEICSINWVKNFNALDHSQSSYITKVKQEKTKCKEVALIDDENKEKKQNDKKKCGCDKKNFIFINGKKYYISKNTKTKNKHGVGAVSSGNYTATGALHAKCLPTPPEKKPFP